MIRIATPLDVESLFRIENRSFLSDGFSTRTFRYLLSKANATLLFSRGTSLARLYSIAVDPEHQGQGIGWSLLRAAEEAALNRDAEFWNVDEKGDGISIERQECS
jgi:ribosomal protein S18 acetylase RimI-like enzyme